MEAKKTMKIILTLAALAIIVFLSVIFLNSHIEYKEQNQENLETAQPLSDLENHQSYAVANLPVIGAEDWGQKGSDEALAVIVYEDYADIFSADFVASLASAQADFGDRLHVVFRPLNINNSNLSRQAALAVLCAADGGQGEAMRARIFNATKNNQFNPEDLSAWAKELGLVDNDFQACLTNSKKKERIDTISAQAENFSVYGAPTTFVGDEMIVGARPYESFTDSNGDEIEGLKQVIERQLK